ncbi:YjfK family protein [Dongshaea marina]|uniref:YjfK family protein n=1 Tax=Dongshaea marina TaxID=2047966 RepID=UPI000D3E59A8|nr:YjfK family protein [Dongshaea marina]
MFDLFKKKKNNPTPKVPEILGLRLGGAIELDALRLKLIEPKLIFEGASSKQLIQAVGEVRLDESSRLLRFYTDDDGFIQVLLQGGNTDAHVVDVKLWYYYDTRPLDEASEWEDLLESGIVKPNWQLEGHSFSPTWPNTRPVAVTEHTWSEDGTRSETDQFMMLYERQADDELAEFVLISAEEKFYQNQPERALVLSTGINLGPVDFSVIG